MAPAFSFYKALGIVLVYTLLTSATKYIYNYIRGDQPTTTISQSKYQFINKTVAYYVLSELDVYEPLEPTYFKETPDFNSYHYGYKPDSQYCEKVRGTFIENPDVVFGKPNVLMLSDKGNYARFYVIPKNYNLMDPYNRLGMRREDFQSHKYTFKPVVTAFLSVYPLYLKREFGLQFACNSQVYDKIPGAEEIERKDYVPLLATELAKNFEGKAQCLSKDKYFPETWILGIREQCVEFFNILNSEAYKEKKKTQRIVFIRKISEFSHRGEGVFPVNEQEEAELRELYDNGAKCGQGRKDYIVQTFIDKPLLINELYKFDFRVYMLIASVDPLIVYYHDGYLRISLVPYNVTSGSVSESTEDDRKMMLTNLMVNDDIYQDVKQGNLYKGMDLEGLMSAQQATVEKLGEYLLSEGIITDPNWTENYLRKEMRKVMIYLSKFIAKGLKKDSRLFHLFGIDFMIDDKMKLWYIETNSAPAFPEYIPSVHAVLLNMLKNQYEIVFGLLRSRMKRVVEFVNLVSIDGSVTVDAEGRPRIADLDEKRAIFKRINKNYFDKEFVPKNNTYLPVLDESKEGAERYHGLLEPECVEVLTSY